jgi:hypothetical protein
MISRRLSIAVASAALIAGACSAAPPATPPPTATLESTPTAAVESAPTAHPTPTTSPIDGAYVTSFTKDELVNSPLLADKSEINDENWGTWTLTFDTGFVYYTQGNELARSESAGKFTIDGDAVALAFDSGANKGETFGYRWRLDGTSLTFERDDAVGLGPTPFLVKPWTKTGGAAAIPLLCCGATLLPSTYTTNVTPGLTLTVGHEVDLDCAAGYICRGDVDVNLPFWLDLEFGNRHGSELMVFSGDKVLDPNVQGRLMDLPDDFAAWIAAQPQLTVAERTHEVVIGTVPAQEFDITQVGQGGLALFPTGWVDLPAIGIGGGGAGGKARLDVLRVGDRQIVIQRTFGPEHAIGTFETAVDGLQPVIDSITWAPSS